MTEGAPLTINVDLTVERVHGWRMNNDGTLSVLVGTEEGNVDLVFPVTDDARAVVLAVNDRLNPPRGRAHRLSEAVARLSAEKERAVEAMEHVEDRFAALLAYTRASGASIDLSSDYDALNHMRAVLADVREGGA